MKTFAITNQKGGSGKTTTAVNLAATLGELGKRTLLIDIDPQSSASSWLGAKEGGRGLFNVFANNGNLTDLVRKTDTPGVDLIPSSSWLIGIDKALAGEVGAELVFRRAVDKLPRDRWDYMLVDCPPSLGLLSVSALVACRYILVPVEAHVMALAGLASLVATTERVRDRLNPSLTLAAILACRVDMRKNLSREVVSRLQDRFGSVLLTAFIRETVRLAEAPSFSRPITAYDPRSTGAEDYRAVTQELLKRSPKWKN